MSATNLHAEVRDFVSRHRLTLHKNVRWEMADYDVATDAVGNVKPDRDATTDIEEAEAVSSLRAGTDTPASFHNGGLHDLLIDVDLEAILVPSSTSGHFHLYAQLGCAWEDYVDFLRAAARIGLIEKGYAEASIARGATSLRLPWIKKGSERAADGGVLPPKRQPINAQEAPF